MTPETATRNARGWIVWLIAGALVNPNVLGPAVKAATGRGLPPITWESLTVLSIALLLLALLLAVAGRVPRVRPLLFVYLVVIAILSVSEIGLRVVRPPGALIQAYGYPPGLLVPDPEIGRRYTPNFEGHFTYLAYRDIPIRTNSLGFRDDEPAGNVDQRVILLGDSIAFGAGVREERRFGDVLERLLADETHRGIEVVNWAINGTETNHQRLLYERIGGSLPHDLVLIGFCLNDVVPVPVSTLYEKTERKSAQTMTWRDRLGERGGSLHYLFVVRLAQSGVRALWAAHSDTETEAQRHRKEYEAFLRRHWADDEEVRGLRAELAAIRSLAAQNGAGVVLAVFPYRFQFESGDFRPQRRLAEIAADLDIPLIDLEEPFRRMMKDRPAYLPGDDCHPSEAMHAAVAEAIAPVIEAALNAEPKERP